MKSVSNQIFCISYIYTEVSLTQRGKQPEPCLHIGASSPGTSRLHIDICFYRLLYKPFKV